MVTAWRNGILMPGTCARWLVRATDAMIGRAGNISAVSFRSLIRMSNLNDRHRAAGEAVVKRSRE
jgi:hypothetical protein